MAFAVAALAGAFGKSNTTTQKLTNDFASSISRHTNLSAECVNASVSENTIKVGPPAPWCGQCQKTGDDFSSKYDPVTGAITYDEKYLPSGPGEAIGVYTKPDGTKGCIAYPEGSVTIKHVSQTIGSETKTKCRLSQQAKADDTTKVKDDLSQRLKHVTQSLSFNAFSKAEDVNQTTKNIENISNSAATALQQGCSVKAMHTNAVEEMATGCESITIGNISQRINAKTMAKCVFKQLANDKVYQDLQTKISDRLKSVEEDTIGDMIRAATGPLIAIAVICIAGAFLLMSGGGMGGGGGGGGSCRGGLETTVVRWLPTTLGLCVTVLAIVTLPGKSWPPWRSYKWGGGLVGGAVTLIFAFVAYKYGGCDGGGGTEPMMPIAEPVGGGATTEAAVGAVEANPELLAL